jgi:hypothetical protein
VAEAQVVTHLALLQLQVLQILAEVVVVVDTQHHQALLVVQAL